VVSTSSSYKALSNFTAESAKGFDDAQASREYRQGEQGEEHGHCKNNLQ
jgi:hypothetical protein